MKLSSVPLLSSLFSRRAAAPPDPPPPAPPEPQQRRRSTGDPTASSDVMPARGVKAAPAPPPAAPPPAEGATFASHRQAPPPAPTTMTAMDHAIRAIDADLVSLLNMTGATLCRALRPPVGSSSGSVARQVRVGTAAARARTTMAAMASAEGGEGGALSKPGGANSPFGPFPRGTEIAQSIEQRVRGLSLETSLTPDQKGRLDRVAQNALDLHLALRCARYAWQISVLMNDDPLGRSVLARVKPVTQAVVEMNGRVASVLEGQHDDNKDAAAAIAGQYRTFFVRQGEVAHSVHGEHSVASRLARACLCCLTLSAENMARVAARYALSDTAVRPAAPKVLPPPTSTAASCYR